MSTVDKTLNLYIETFGCQMNVADSEEMSRHFLRFGFKPTSNLENAHVVLLNTCTVRQHAEQKALSYIGRLRAWKKQNRERKIVVAGCAAERLKNELRRRFPFVDLVVGAKSIDQFPQILQDELNLEEWKESQPNVESKTHEDLKNGNLITEDLKTTELIHPKKLLSPFEINLSPDVQTAYITTMRGCNYSCAYCIVPSVRGRETYRDPQEICNELESKLQSGARKIWLLGQTVNSYWYKISEENRNFLSCELNQKYYDFADLIQKISSYDLVDEVRFMSPHPHYMTDKLIQVIGKNKKISNEIHLPVQSGSNRMLEKMKRNYTREKYIVIASKLKQAVPNLALSTDFIVGFPGETQEDFNETINLAKEIEFSLAYCFKYSSRAGTESAQWEDDIPQSIKEERLQVLLNVMSEIQDKRKEKLSVIQN